MKLESLRLCFFFADVPLSFRTYSTRGFLRNMATIKGSLVTPLTGLYFVYAQLYFKTSSSVAPGFGLYLNNIEIAHSTVSLTSNSPYVTGYLGRLICLVERGSLQVRVSSDHITIGTDPDRTYFGAFLVSRVLTCSNLHF